MKAITKPTPAMAVALVALFIALGGGAYATVTANSVRSINIVNGQVKNADLGNGSVGTLKLKNGSVTPAKLSAGVFTNLNTRYLGKPVTVVARSSAIAVGSFGGTTATCPAGMVIIGGGVDPTNVLTMSITGSHPVINGSNPVSLPVGQYGAATAWRGFARNESAAAPATVTVTAVCAKIG